MRPYPPRVWRDLDVVPRGNSLAARWLHEPQPISNHPVGLGFPHLAGRYQPGGSAFSYPGWSRRDMEGILIRGSKIILPGCAGTSALAREATLGARWLHEPHPQPASGAGVSTPCAGRYRPGRSAFTSLGCRSCRDMEEGLTRDGNLSSPGAAGPRRWPEGKLSPRAGSMSLSQ